MVIISKTILADFGAKNPDAVEARNKWHEVSKKANWNNYNQMKQSFNTVDYVGNDSMCLIFGAISIG